MRASEPLKSKRLAISLLVCSTAFFTSWRSTWETMSKEGMAFLAVEALQVLDPARGRGLDPLRIGGEVAARVDGELQHLAVDEQQGRGREQVGAGPLAAEVAAFLGRGHEGGAQDRVGLGVAPQLGDQVRPPRGLLVEEFAQ